MGTGALELVSLEALVPFTAPVVTVKVTSVSEVSPPPGEPGAVKVYVQEMLLPCGKELTGTPGVQETPEIAPEDGVMPQVAFVAEEGPAFVQEKLKPG
jgi:hypothetical protein